MLTTSKALQAFLRIQIDRWRYFAFSVLVCLSGQSGLIYHYSRSVPVITFALGSIGFTLFFERNCAMKLFSLGIAINPELIPDTFTKEMYAKVLCDTIPKSFLTHFDEEAIIVTDENFETFKEASERAYYLDPAVCRVIEWCHFRNGFLRLLPIEDRIVYQSEGIPYA